MIPWQDDILLTVSEASAGSDPFCKIEAVALSLGFEYCAYGARAAFPLTRPATLIRNNYPTAWQSLYVEQNYVLIDPTVKQAGMSSLPFIWSKAIYHQTSEFWEEARAHGLSHGWAQSTSDRSGVQGMLTLARSAEPLMETELIATGHRLVWLTQVAHMAMLKAHGSTLLPVNGRELSPREISVLRWTAEGKTASEVGNILNIMERTVNFHLANAMQKLDANNKTAAVVKAALLGVL